MANTILNPSIIAKAAVRILDNELVMANRVYRGYEDEFAKRINGYEAGDTITIRKPNQFRVQTVITADSPVQDVTEGKLTMQINQVRGVDFSFTSTQLTLNIGELADRVIKPAMVQLANAIDTTLMAPALEGRAQPERENFVGELECHDPSADRQDVRIVVLA